MTEIQNPKPANDIEQSALAAQALGVAGMN